MQAGIPLMNEEVLRQARLIWDYHLMQHELKKSGCILVLGSHDTRVAERGAQLFLEGWAPLLIMSGGLGRLTKNSWTETEADRFARIARNMCVPAEALLIENRSTNTGENILFTRALLEQHQLDPADFMLVQKPYMERRSFATFKKRWPEKDVRVTSPQISFDDYPAGDITMEKIIQIMVGDLQRIKIYPGKGFQIEQTIPEEVWSAFEFLVAAGYTEAIVNS
jgi:uncharacterized SAM-binding protein YcdF (DUF218 family)